MENEIKEGKQVSVWTVNDEVIMKKVLFKKKVHAIVTDFPDKAKEILKI